MTDAQAEDRAPYDRAAEPFTRRPVLFAQDVADLLSALARVRDFAHPGYRASTVWSYLGKSKEGSRYALHPVPAPSYDRPRGGPGARPHWLPAQVPDWVTWWLGRPGPGARTDLRDDW